MPSRVDFQIVGGGLIGLSAGYALAARGASVRILEKRSGIAEGTSFANAGMVHASLADPWNGPGVGRQLLASLFDSGSPMKIQPKFLPGLSLWGLKYLRASRPARHAYATQVNFALAVYAVDTINNWRETLRIQDDFQRKGLLKIFRSQAGFDAARRIADQLADLGFAREYLSASGIAAVEPALAPIADDLKHGIYYADDYGADAYKFCKALETEIIRLGGQILTGETVSSLVQSNSAVTGAKGTSGFWPAGTTIIAAGARTADLLAPLGIRLALKPVKGYSLTYDMQSKMDFMPKLPVIDESLHAAITPFGPRLRIAGTAEFTGFDPSLRPQRLRPLQGMLEDIYPALAEGKTAAQAKAWAGYRPVSADGIPFIGRAGIDGLAINSGHGHMGWTFSAGSGALLADMLLGAQTSINPAPYAPLRRI